MSADAWPRWFAYGVSVAMSACFGGQPRQLRHARRSRPALGGDRRPPDAGIVARLGEGVDLVAPERLRGVHRRVRVAHEVVDPQVAPRAARDADRHGHLHGQPLVDPDPCRAHENPELLGQRRRVLDGGLGEDQHELLAAVPAEHVGCAEVGAQHVGDAAEDHVPHVVTVGVVHGLEQVDVDEAHRERPVVARGPLDLAEQHAEDRRAIRDPGEAVDRRRVVCHGERGTQLGDGPCQPVIEAAAVRRHGGPELARGEALGGAHHGDHASADPDARDSRGQAPAEDGGNQQHGRLHAAGRHRAARAHEDEEHEAGDRSQQPQPPEGAYHGPTVRAANVEQPVPKVPPEAQKVPVRSRAGRPGWWPRPRCRLVYSARPDAAGRPVPRRRQRLSEAGISVAP